MSISKNQSGHAAVAVLLAAANVLMFASWPWLRGLRLDSDSSDPPFSLHGGEVDLDSQALMRNEAYLRWFADCIRADEGILFFGTSESVGPHNLAAQLNHLRPDDPGMVVVAKGGMSLVHSCLVFARCQREAISLPPLVLIINPVYFTRSHDVISDGWISSVMRSPVFYQMDHRGIRAHLRPEVRRAYREHFAGRRVLYPVWMQEYLGNLLYLRFHPRRPEPVRAGFLPVPRYEFDGVVPEYDQARAVPVGYRASDQWAKRRWTVKPADECVNLMGLASSVSFLQNQPAPVLLVVLPTNRTFYRYNGLDMQEYDQRYRQIRSVIAAFAKPGHIYLLDVYETPKLHLGFKDRMHPDAYGYHQLASHVVESEEYARFIRAVGEYYAESPSGPTLAPQGD